MSSRLVSTEGVVSGWSGAVLVAASASVDFGGVPRPDVSAAASASAANDDSGGSNGDGGSNDDGGSVVLVAPGRPSGLSVVESSGGVVLSWDDPGDGSISGYRVLRRTKGTHAIGVFATLVGDTASADTQRDVNRSAHHPGS